MVLLHVYLFVEAGQSSSSMSSSMSSSSPLHSQCCGIVTEEQMVFHVVRFYS